ncbi:MAG: thermonuclease family protein [Planctomycetota bacterium]
MPRVRRPTPRKPPTPTQARRQRRRRRIIVVTLALAGVLLLARLDHLGLLFAPGSDFDRYHGQTFTVLRVIDGDTLVIDAPDPTQSPARPHTRVRLWGIDAPETAKPQRNLPAERGAAAATAYLEQLAMNQPITLYLEAHRPRGRFGRLLAHAAVSDTHSPASDADAPPTGFAQRSLSHALVAAGLAKADDTWPHGLTRQLQAAEDHARGQRLGIWSRGPIDILAFKIPADHPRPVMPAAID